MFVHVCMCICTFIFVEHLCLYMYVCVYTHVCTYMYAQTLMCGHVCMCIHTYLAASSSEGYTIYTQLYVYMYMYVVYMHII